MKTFRFFTLALAFACLNCLCSCNDDDEPAININQVTEADVVGVWQWTCWEGTEDGGYFKEDYENDPSYQDMDHQGRHIFIFESDGCLRIGEKYPGEPVQLYENGSWELVDGEPSVIKITEYNHTTECDFIYLSKDKMQITYNIYADFYENNTVLTLKRLKSLEGYDFSDLE